ncbi:MAG TPA: MopE-related protein [Sandaracinaceae bacterium LLY-WYZ-13_1]|nr:MopE-related protein [Sandaracinaceae bacterium LLY-WYZ-13_1]
MPRAPIHRRALAALACLISSASGCDADAHLLAIQLQTDLIPRAEFASVEVRLDGERVATPGLEDGYVEPRRVAEVDGLPSGRHEVEVILGGSDGDVARAAALIELRGSSSITVRITRDCQGVSCDDPRASSCYAGRCADPACPEDPSACPPAECEGGADCPAPDDCAEAVCLSGACFYRPLGACAEGTYCDPEDGCRPFPTPTMDAGVSDAGGLDGGPGCTGGDADGDGVACDVDCDDGDPWVYPGAAEVCDGVRNDCDEGVADEGCGGVGTFVSTSTGSDANPGTRAAPLATVSEGIANAALVAAERGMPAAVYIAEGTYDEDLSVPAAVSLEGGYEAAGWTRERAPDRVVIRASRVEGTVVEAGDDVALRHLTLRGTDGFGTRAALTLAAGASATVEGNRIVGPASTDVHAYALEVLDGPASPRIADNEILIASGAPRGAEGLHVVEGTVVVVDNAIRAETPDGPSWTGVYLQQPGAGTRVERNEILGVAASAGETKGVYLLGGSARIRDNLVDAGDAGSARSTGIFMQATLADVDIVNNRIFAGRGPSQAGIEWFADSGNQAGSDLLVHSNSIFVRDATTGRGIYYTMDTAGPGVGRFYNNVIQLSLGSGGTGCAFDPPPPASSPAVFENNALRLEDGAAAYCDFAMRDLAWLEGQAFAAMNVETDCALSVVDRTSDVRLPAGSPCLDIGASTDVPADDFEGDPRPSGAGPDIGADERP